MIDPTHPSTIIDRSPVGSSQLVVETHTGSQAKEALKAALPQPGQSAGPVPFESENALAGRKYRLDPLVYGGQMRTLSRLVPAVGPHHARIKIFDRPAELSAGVSLVAKERLPAPASAAGKEGKVHLSFISLERGDLKDPKRPVRREDAVQPKSPEVAGMGHEQRSVWHRPPSGR